MKTPKISVQSFLSVPPDHVEMRKEPDQLKPGQTATLTCESSSSHPPARMSWWKDGHPVELATTTNTSKPGLHGGVVTSIQMKVNVTTDIGGTKFTCQATNEALQRSVNDVFTLDVLCKSLRRYSPFTLRNWLLFSQILFSFGKLLYFKMIGNRIKISRQTGTYGRNKRALMEGYLRTGSGSFLFANVV